MWSYTEFAILDWIQGLRTPAGDAVLSFITKLGNMGMVWILLAVVLLVIPKTRRSGVILTAALCADFVLCNGILKNLIARTRPYDVNTMVSLLIQRPGDFSFPSGHTAASFAAVGALYMAGEKRLWKIAFVLGIFIAFSRLYFYVHYPTDIVGGMVVGLVSGYIGYRMVLRFSGDFINRL